MTVGRGQKSGLAQVGGGSGTSLTVTWGTNPAAGSSILLLVQSGAPPLQPTSVTDNGTTPATFTLDASNTTGGSSGLGVYIYRANNITLPSAGSYAVTITLSATRTLQAGGIEYTGMASGPPDATAANQSAGGTSVTTGSAGPAAAGGVVFGGFADFTGLNPETITFTGSAPQGEQFRNTNGSTWAAMAVADALAGSAQNFPWTLGDSVAWQGAAAAYSPASSGGGGGGGGGGVPAAWGPLPVLPQIIVEAGLLADAPVQGGTTLFLNTGPGLGTGTLGTAIGWTDLSSRVLSFTITRPSTRLQGPLWNYQAGTCSVTFDNSDGALDPDNLAGPFTSGGATLLVPMVPFRIRAVFATIAYPLFSGFADGWLPAQVTYEGGYAELTVSATDAFKILAGVTIPAGAIEGVGADTGARVKDILNRALWYASGDRSAIDTGNSTLQGTTLGDTALNLMQIATDSEIGQLYVNGSGAVAFRRRQALQSDARSNVPQAVFGDLPGTVQTAGTELAFAALTRASDDTTIANDIQATRLGGTLQEAKDTASITKYLFPRTYARADLILQGDPDALSWAQWVLYVSKGGEDRFETLAVDPLADPYTLWPQVLGREIGDRIQVWHRPAGLASPVTKDCFAAGITHAWDSVTSAWLTTWTLQDASKYGSFFTLDNPALGKLDANALTF